MCPFINLGHDSMEKSWGVITEMTVGIVIRTVVSSGEWRAMDKGMGQEFSSKSLRTPLALHLPQ